MKISKKGSFPDLLFVFLVCLVFGIMVVISTYIKDQIFPSMEAFYGEGSYAKNVSTQVGGSFAVFDNIFMLIYFMLCLVPILSAILVKTNPVWFVINIMVLLIILYITPVFSNIMLAFWNTPQFGVYAYGGGGSTTYPVMTLLFKYLPYVTVAISAILSIAMFGKGEGL